jgi:alpha-L-fucosidase 2
MVGQKNLISMYNRILTVLLVLLMTHHIQAQDTSLYNSISQHRFNPATLLWYDKPATLWNEALPVGNGRLGGMVFGNATEERIQLNEDTYWTGGPYNAVVKDGYKALPDIRKLVFAGEMQKAHNLFGRTLMGYPVEQQKYQSLANLRLFFKNTGEITGYKRWLDLETGIASLQYTINGITYRRDVFSTAPDQVIVVRITASKAGSISFKANLQGVRNQEHSNYGTDYFRMDGDGKESLILTGKSADYLGVAGKLKYEARLKAVTDGGKLVVDDKDLIVENANTVTLYFAAATNFVNYKDVSADQHERVLSYLEQIRNKSFATMLQAHLQDYKKLFDRVSLQLPTTDNAWLPTNERMERNKTEADPQLAALAYQFGRYVLISSSRPGTQAANLQGIWNDDMNPAWDSKYTTNINLEMNYWPVASANLRECAEPLVQLVKELTDQGTAVAKEHYGCRGWVCHQNTDLWRATAPMDGPAWGAFTPGGAWLCTMLWEQYQFTQDKKYLQDIYPLLKGAVDFYMDFLVPHPNGKWLVTNPSTSPENFPASPSNGPFFDEVTGGMLPGTTICSGASIDMQILTDLFGGYVEAAGILGKDATYATEVTATRKRLPPPKAGKDGTLQEWADDWGQLEKEHRHASHMYGLYPGNVLSPVKTPALMDACKAVLEQRGDGATGWSRAWKTALWARLHDGNRANKIFKGYLKDQASPQLFAKCGKPMQVDATLGMTAAISEMLLQSHEGVIDLLPALPDEWMDGAIKGICARGAFQLQFKWEKGKVTRVELLSEQGQPCRIRTGTKLQLTANGRKVKAQQEKDGSLTFPTTKGTIYILE